MVCSLRKPKCVAIYKVTFTRSLNIIGVSLDKDADKWKEAIAKDKLTWNHVSNLKFWDEPIAAQYGVESIPATFILDASVKIVAKFRGDELRTKSSNFWPNSRLNKIKKSPLWRFFYFINNTLKTIQN
jgi:hypothetical protein